MPTYDYECSSCGRCKEEFHGMSEEPIVSCNECAGTCKRVILTPTNLSVPPNMQAAGGKMKYYGIKNIFTGEGITQDTDVSEPVGITTKNKQANNPELLDDK